LSGPARRPPLDPALKRSEFDGLSPGLVNMRRRALGTTSVWVAGWGIVGAVLLGPVGLLAGLLAGGRGKDVTFVGVHKDGRKFFATTDSKTYTKISAALF
jgi:hypothetical protein